MILSLRFGSIAASLFLILGQGLVDARTPDPGSSAQNKKGKQGGNRRAFPAPQTAWEIADCVLGSPTNSEMSIVVHFKKDLTGYLEYGPQGTSSFQRTTDFSVTTGSRWTTVLQRLRANTRYVYRLRYRLSGESDYQNGPLYEFNTQRTTGQPFSFYVQGDSHPERTPKMCDPVLYERTLVSAAKTKPDFYICLGDDFSVDTLNEFTQSNIESVYRKQVPYLGLVGKSAPIFLVNGNHEQAAKANLDGTSKSLAAMVQNTRNAYFACPAPNDFYSGDTDSIPGIGLLRDYYAWTWGDALFVVIDPYWHSDVAVDNRADGGQKNRDLWKITLGDKQYQWLKKTLEESHAKFKFVFSHHVSGTGRGGVECAPYYEWGGKDRNGRDAFAQQRPGWAMPIHQLFVKTGVSVFFQGHDHIFAKQILDGVIYQTAPCPGDATYALMNEDAYTSGDKLPGSGVLRVTVDGKSAKVEYVRSYLPADETDKKKTGEIAYSYTVNARSK